MEKNEQEQRNRDQTQAAAFARHVFDNGQNLIARMDGKAGAVLVIVGLLTSSLLAATSRFKPDLNSLNFNHYVIYALLLTFFVAIIAVVLEIKSVLLARLGDNENTSDSPRLIFPSNIISMYGSSSKNYYNKISNLSSDEMIRNYSQQIVANSRIFNTKAVHVNKAIKAMLTASIVWLMECVALISVEIAPDDPNSCANIVSKLFIIFVGAAGIIAVWSRKE